MFLSILPHSMDQLCVRIYNEIVISLTFCSLHIAPNDYINVDFPVIFTPDDLTNRIFCKNISISTDSIVEDTEVFLVVIYTLDESVQLLQMGSFVVIFDNSSKCHVGRVKNYC